MRIPPLILRAAAKAALFFGAQLFFRKEHSVLDE